ncbi:DUF2520 domain-containing protein [Enterococcus faecalis]|nr:DUF2520 domain-containing protein [Enterococcus faecalis]
MEVIIMNVGFIGAGKVGCSFGKYFQEHKIQVTGFYSKSEDSSLAASNFTSSKQYLNLRELVDENDTIFITTPDGQIQEVWQEIKNYQIKNKLICHCSGAISSDIFSNIQDYGAYGYSVHPMFSISDKYNSYKKLKKSFITIEGDEKYAKFLCDFFKKLGNSTVIVSKENKFLYHAESVVSSNLVLGLINTSVTYLIQCGFTEKMAIEALYPLIEFNIRNIKEKGIIESLTGPVERCDISTIKGHCEVLSDEDRALYMLLSKNVLEIAMLKNINRDYSELEKYLGES